MKKLVFMVMFACTVSFSYVLAENLPEWENIPKLDFIMYAGNNGALNSPHATGEFILIMDPCHQKDVQIVVSENDSLKADDYLRNMGFNLNFATKWQHFEVATIGGVNQPVYAEFKIPTLYQEKCYE